MNGEKIFIVSGPSGSGEDSIIKGLEKRLDIQRPITTTTRKKRKNESEGNPYHFIEREVFEKKIAEGMFFEWTQQDNGNLYGVTNTELENMQSNNKISILKVDYQGVITVKKIFGNSAVAIFINCPLDQMEQRIKSRDNVSDEFVIGRLEHAKGWIEHRDIFDYEVMNDDGNLEKSIDTIEDIIKKHQTLSKIV